MKVAICLFKYFPYGGLQHDCIKIVQECLNRHYQVDLYTMKWQGDPAPKGCQVVTVPVKGFSNHRRCAEFSRYIATQINRDDYQVIVGFNRMAGLDCYFAGDVCFAAESRVKHGFWFRFTSRYRTFKQLEQTVFSPQNHCRILALTHQQIETYRRYYDTPSERFHLLAPMINRQFCRGDDYATIRQHYRQQLACENFAVMLMVGSSFQRKGLDRALHALAALPTALRQQSMLWVIGEDNTKSWQSLAKQLGVIKQVRFLGPQQQVRPFYCAADCLIHPAYQEAAGMVLLEAVACGLPVITTDVCGYAFHIIKSRGGMVLSSPFKQQQLNDSVARLLADKHLRQGYITNTMAYCQQISLYNGQVDVVNQLEAIAKDKQESPHAE